ncbi:unnamed protein product [Caenorhabditis brenneri]
MKLFRYPVLVFDNIIKQLDPVPLLYLSFCSRKTSQRLKRVSFAIEDAWFSNESAGERGYYFALKFPSQQILNIIFQSAPESFGRLPENLRIGDTVYKCRYSEPIQKNSVYLGCVGYKKASLFFNYIFDLVRARINKIEIDLNKLSNTKLFLSEPCFKNIQKVRLAGRRTDSRKVIELYDCFEKPVLESLVGTHIASLSPASKLLQSENLAFDPSKVVSIEHLLNFNGKYISLECSSLLEEDIVTFVKHWLDGNYPNLEGASITLPVNWEYEPEKVLDEFITKQWNPAERAQNFIYKASYSRDEKNEFPKIDCSNGKDLERSDGLLATILYSEPVQEHSIYLGSIGYKKASLFFNYIFDLVRARINKIVIGLNRLNNTKQFLSEPCFKNIHKITLAGRRTDSKKAIELYDYFDEPLLETRVISHIKSLSPTSKLSQSENLYIDSSKFISIEHLLNFTGKYISLGYSSILEDGIVAFVKHWLDGNYPNLEGAHITCPIELEYETEKVLDEFNTKRWNPAERAQKFIFKASFSSLDQKVFPLRDCSNGFDIERSDGLLATMRFEDDDCDAWLGNGYMMWRGGYSVTVQFFSQQVLSICFQSPPKRIENYLEKFSVRIGDVSYDCRYLIEGRSIFLGSIGYKKASMFFNYFLDLVRTGINRIVINLNGLTDIKQFLSEPCFKNVQKITLVGKNTPENNVIELYDCFEKPIRETFVLSHIKSLSPTSKLLQSENLGLEKSKVISIEHLLNFSGKYISLKCSSLLEEHLVAFIKHWLDGNYPNLEGAYIKTPMNMIFEPERVLNEFNTKQWNPAERAQKFIYKASYSRDEKNEFPKIECSNGNDLERSDAWFGNGFMRQGVTVQFFSQQELLISLQSPLKGIKKYLEKFSVRIGDVSYDCRYLIEGRSISLGCIGYKKASLFFNYILDLVRARINRIVINLNGLTDIKQFLSEPCFKNVQKITLAGRYTPENNVIELYDCFEKPIRETFVLSHLNSLSPTSKLLQSENLGLEKSKFISIEHLLNFSGKYISLKCSSLLEEHLIAFIKHWLDGNYPNLEGAYITTPMNMIFKPERVLNEFNTKRWNPAERAQKFIFKATFSSFDQKVFPIRDCSNGFDIERNDGLLASILFGEHEYDFYFYVWHNRFP